MAKSTHITPELCRELLSYDAETGKLRWLPRARSHFATDHACRVWNGRFAHAEALTSVTVSGYKAGAVKKRYAAAHRVAWMVHTGRHPDGEIDHINGDRSDNRFNNLRDVSARDNCRNKSRYRNSADRAGVHHDPRVDKWSARIGDLFLGSFFTKEEANAARSAGEICMGYHANHGRPK